MEGFFFFLRSYRDVKSKQLIFVQILNLNSSAREKKEENIHNLTTGLQDFHI